MMRIGEGMRERLIMTYVLQATPGKNTPISPVSALFMSTRKVAIMAGTT